MDGVPLRDALALPALQHVRVLAGSAGLGRPVRYVNVMEVPDILNWVKPDELLLTTAYPLRDDRAALTELVPQLARRGLAGLAVKPARYLDEVPPVMCEAADALSFPLLELPPETVLADIINAVLGLILNAQAARLQRSAAVHERFTAIVLSGGGLREIVQALAELLARPAAILDASGALLARSTDFPSAAPELTCRGQQAFALGVDSLSWIDLPRGSDFGRAAVQPIKSGPELLGMAVVLADTAELGEEPLMALERAATVAALRLVQARAVAEADSRFQAVCLEELVTGHLADRAVLRERAMAFGWDLSVPRAVLVAEIDTLGGRRFSELAGTPEEGGACRGVAGAARSVLGPETIVWERSVGAAALAPGTELRARAEALRAEAARRRPGAIVSVGVGRVCPDPLALQVSYTEALRALQVGRGAGAVGQVCLFDELGLDRLLLSCAPAELEAFHEATLGCLLRYEQAHPACALLATLETYLAEERNIARTARKLYVHYNTVKYRLERLERLLGPFVDVPDRCLSMELATRVGRLLAPPR